LYPKQIVHLIDEQASELKRPPLTVTEVLDNLALHAPMFAAPVRSARGRRQS
jgi:hypothetical protein